MKLNILSNRTYEKRHWYDLVFEWEDELKRIGKLEFLFEPRSLKNRWCSFTPFLYRYIIRSNYTNNEYSVYFEMKANVFHFQKNIKRLIPWIIDWYVPERYLGLYKFMYSRHKLVLISSCEVYEYLKKKKWNNIAHLALSIPDKYKVSESTEYKKIYDVVLIGRQNPVLLQYLTKYKLKHNISIYSPSVEEKDTREKYMQALSKGKVSLYVTPGTDDFANRTKGFSQVTPRFLEMLASGCHILARYRKNADTEYYELDSFCPSINSYEEFEKRLDYYLSTDVDMKRYSAYLLKHYTSSRMRELYNITKGM